MVLLHGLGRTRRSMGRLQRALERAGYTTWSWTYPSRELPIAALADRVHAELTRDLGVRPLMAVTHSLGGILVRHLTHRVVWDRVVMLAPPNQGSQLARSLGRYRWFHRVFGPVAGEVCDATGWPPAPPGCGIIAGTAGASILNPPSLVTSGGGYMPRGLVHDGTVTVDETRLPDSAAFATVPATHTWIMNHPMARALILRFLATGSFDGPDPA